MENSDPYGQHQGGGHHAGAGNQHELGHQMHSGTDSQNSQNNGGQTEIEQQTNTDGDTEQVSVYMKDNMIMRRIQIEGDDREFLMDPQGQIFDMNGQFIGTANTNELEELQEDSQNQNGAQQNEHEGANTNQNHNEEGNQGRHQEEMMLLDDDDDLLLPENQAHNGRANARDGGHREI